MFKRLILAGAFSLLGLGSALAACTNPLAIKDATAATISMSMASGADGFCQYNFNLSQVNATAVATGSGVMTAGTQRTALATDSPGIVTLGQTTKSASVPMVIASDQLGAAADTASMPVILSPSGNATAGITPVVGGSAVSSLVLKASAGSLYAAYANCTSACWLMIFNSVSAPSNGATTAGVASGNMVECIPIGAGSVGGVNYAPGPPAVYSVGMTAAISSTACTTLTLSTVAMIHGMVK